MLLRNFAAAAGLAACASFALSGAAHAGKTQYPLTLENCGKELTFTKAPERTVSVGQSTTEILYLLGQADKITGTALWIGPVIEGYEEVNATVPRLADNAPSFESVTGARPELVTTQFQWQIGPQGVVATVEQFEELGIAVYTSPADCIGKDNSAGDDGLRKASFSMDLIYQEIEDLARIFDVEDRGAALIAELKEREEAARRKIGAVNGEVSAVFWFSSADLAIDPYVAGQKGAPGYMTASLGLTNVIESDEEWPTVGWETIARSNPTVIVAGKMDRRRFPADDVELKQKFLKEDPVTSLMPAVKEGRIIVMDAQAMNPTIRTIEGMEVLADALAGFGLAK